MKTSPTHYRSFFAFLLFAFSAMFLFMLASILGLSAVVMFFESNRVDPQAATYFVSFGFLTIILMAASVISFIRFLNNPNAEKPVSTVVPRSRILIGIILTCLSLLAGYLSQNDPSINWLALPLLTIPAAALPIWLLLCLATKDLPFGSRWRTWGTFGLSMSFTPFLLFMLEIVVIIFISLFVLIYVMANPQLSMELQRLSSQLMNIDPESEEIIKLFMPYLAKPSVLITAFTLFSLIIPMMEEALKPLGVWLLAGRLNSPAQGFAFGALCGAGFALVETLNTNAQTDQWATVLFARIGTGAMHITTSALIGSAIISARHERRYLRLLAIYLLAVFLHGSWNAAALTNGFSSILADGQFVRVQTLLLPSAIALVVLTLGLITILIRSNRFYRKNYGSDIMEAAIDPEGDEST